jgi:hypothetical protein
VSEKVVSSIQCTIIFTVTLYQFQERVIYRLLRVSLAILARRQRRNNQDFLSLLQLDVKVLILFAAEASSLLDGFCIAATNSVGHTPTHSGINQYIVRRARPQRHVPK